MPNDFGGWSQDIQGGLNPRFGLQGMQPPQRRGAPGQMDFQQGVDDWQPWMDKMGPQQMGLGENQYAQSPEMNQFDAQGGAKGEPGRKPNMQQYLQMMQMGMGMMPGIRNQALAQGAGGDMSLGRHRSPFRA